MDEGHERRRTCSRRRTTSGSKRRRPRSAGARACAAIVTPAHRAGVHREPRQSPTGVAAGRRCSTPRRGTPTPQAKEARAADLGVTARATRCVHRRRAARSTTRRGSTSSCTTTAARSASRCGRSSPTTATRRWSTRLVGNASIEEEGAAADVVVAATEDLELDSATVLTTGAPVLLQEHQRLPRGRHADARRHRRRDHGRSSCWCSSTCDGGCSRWPSSSSASCGRSASPATSASRLSVVTIAGLPVMLGVGIDYAIQMHSRIEEEVVIDSEDHPIQETSRNLGPALLVVTFDADLRLRRPAVRTGADDPRLRAAARGRHRRDLPLQHHPAAVDPRHPRVQVADDGQGLPPGAARPARLWLGSLPRRSRVPLAVVSVVIFFGGLVVEDDLVLQTDPVEWVDQNSRSPSSDREARGGDGIIERARRVRAVRRCVRPGRGRLRPRVAYEQLGEHDDDGLLLTASSIVTTMSYILEIAGATSLRPARRGRASGVRRRAGRHPVVDS